MVTTAPRGRPDRRPGRVQSQAVGDRLPAGVGVASSHLAEVALIGGGGLLFLASGRGGNIRLASNLTAGPPPTDDVDRSAVKATAQHHPEAHPTEAQAAPDGHSLDAEIHQITLAVDDDTTVVEAYHSPDFFDSPRFQTLPEPPLPDAMPSAHTGGAATLAHTGASRPAPWATRGAATTVPTPPSITRVPTPPTPVDRIPPPAATRRRRRVPQPQVRTRGTRRLGCGGRPAGRPTATRTGPTADDGELPRQQLDPARHLRQRRG